MSEANRERDRDQEVHGLLSLQVDLGELSASLWAGRWLALAVLVICTVGAAFVARGLPDYYASSMLVAPAGDEAAGAMNSLSSRYGGLAAMAGLDLGGGDIDRTTLALATLRSRGFLTDFVLRHELRVPLLAARSWEESSGLVIDGDVFDPDRGGWVSGWKGKPNQPPPVEVAYRTLLNEHLEIDREDESGLIRLTVEHFSPEFAHRLLTLLLHDLNEHMRERDQREAESMLVYLEGQLQQTQVADLRQVLFQLVEQQTKRLMMTEARAEYAFETVDPAYVPYRPAGPSRLLVVLLGLLSGLVLLIAYHAVRVAR